MNTVITDDQTKLENLRSSHASGNLINYLLSVESLLDGYYQDRYGMSESRFYEINSSESLQQEFKPNYGITFSEYISRIDSGELMGVSMVEGKWKTLAR